MIGKDLRGRRDAPIRLRAEAEHPDAGLSTERFATGNRMDDLPRDGEPSLPEHGRAVNADRRIHGTHRFGARIGP
jgi:hypothetical protein